MKEIIPLTRKYKGLSIQVDDADFAILSTFSWFVDKYNNTFYAYRKETRPNGKRPKEYIHRVILGIVDSKTIIDHINGNPLNNQRNNLRIATNQENNRNRSIHRNNKSGFKGVSFNKQRNVWQAYIMIDYKNIYLGSFDSAEKAAYAYNNKAKELFGDFYRGK